jgi:hypothetical protein
VSTHKKELRELGVVDWVKPGQEGNPHASALYTLNWGVLQKFAEEPWRVPAKSSSPRSPTPRSRRRNRPTPERTAPPPSSPATTETASPPLALANTTESIVLARVEAEGVFTTPKTPDVSAEVAEAVEAAEAPQVAESAEAVREPQPPAEALHSWEVAQTTESTPDPWEISEEEAIEVLQEPQDPTEGLEVRTVMIPTPLDAAPGLSAVTPEPLAEVSTLPGASSPSFEVPMALVWTLWREAYLRVYHQPYLPTPADRSAARQLARSCAEVVLLHEARSGAPTRARLTSAQDYLRHVFDGFLRRPGRGDYLKERRHPLSALPGDLNALGLPWAAPRPTPNPSPPPPPQEVLPPAERKARIQEFLKTLKTSPTPGPRPNLPPRRQNE